MKSLNEHINEGKLPKFKDPKYKIYLPTWGKAIDEISDYVKKNGYEYDEEQFFNIFGDAFNKPKPGKTYKAQFRIFKKYDNVTIDVGYINAQIYGS